MRNVHKVRTNRQLNAIMYSVAEEMQAFLPSSLLIYVDVVRLSLPRLMRTLD